MPRAIIALALISTAYATAVASSKSCEQLGWIAAGKNDNTGGSTVCGASWCAQPGAEPHLSNTAASRTPNPNVAKNPSPEEKVTFTKAKEICTTAGARLCTQKELESDEARGSGCKLNWGRVWSSTECTSTNGAAVEAVYTMQGSMAHMTDDKTHHPTTCTDKVASETHFVRCCADWRTPSMPNFLKKKGVTHFSDLATHHKSHFDSNQVADAAASHNATDDTWKPAIGARVRGFQRCCDARNHAHGSFHTTCSVVEETHFDTDLAKDVSHFMVKINHKLAKTETRKTDEYNCQPDGSMSSGCRCCECINGAAIEENGVHKADVVLQLPKCRDEVGKAPKCNVESQICHHTAGDQTTAVELVYNPKRGKCALCGGKDQLACPKKGCSDVDALDRPLALNTIVGHNAEGKCQLCGGKNQIPCAGLQCNAGFTYKAGAQKCKE